jgi:hypothetical protein
MRGFYTEKTEDIKLLLAALNTSIEQINKQLCAARKNNDDALTLSSLNKQLLKNKYLSTQLNEIYNNLLEEIKNK